MKESIRRLQDVFEKVIFTSIFGAFLFGVISSNMVNAFINDVDMGIKIFAVIVLIGIILAMIFIIKTIKYVISEQFDIECRYAELLDECKKTFCDLEKSICKLEIESMYIP